MSKFVLTKGQAHALMRELVAESLEDNWERFKQNHLTAVIGYYMRKVDPSFHNATYFDLGGLDPDEILYDVVQQLGEQIYKKIKHKKRAG